MFWVFAGIVIVGFAALLWWWSGRGEETPPRPTERTRSGSENDHTARSEGGGSTPPG